MLWNFCCSAVNDFWDMNCIQLNQMIDFQIWSRRKLHASVANAVTLASVRYAQSYFSTSDDIVLSYLSATNCVMGVKVYPYRRKGVS